ncbi:hypothetical protein SPRG_09203 [Saprolegnia parasitica CBS 223.65]|uniref:t-SNARE coiled-coil homology domain-containing protein n=1 Tax=Saprolegnia parasitica (strain CBS 223.65) TaxID=695850 RepID=A0A067C2R0_SAPPC|nr:hypothetical protein SPRG_09203 [Saprolegnia parasitica CBS 223.65]KDO25064.1 hypothetical protein SPRG_09203 [Saprolegnia parasitica CBS 223.65]|eukprot:XP_012204138.1 hypothetical protein SPRG_09203 [Saprolegnia parasitica CBS 223.65]
MDAVPERFAGLEEDYIDCKRTINNCIHDLTQTDQKNAARQLAQATIVEAQRCLKLMAVEIRGRSPTLRKEMQAKINVYRDEIAGFQRDLERAMLLVKATPPSATASSANDAARYDRIVTNTNRLQRSSDQLEQSKRIVAETEQIGITVMDTLAQQRETLLSTHDKVRETRELTGDARRVLLRMSQRVLTNKITLWFVIVVLVISICLVFYHDFIHPISMALGD